jgi:hypothetical protein
LSTALHACLSATDPDTSSGRLTKMKMIESDDLRELLEILVMKWEQMLELNFEDYLHNEKLLRNWIRIVQQVLDEV